MQRFLVGAVLAWVALNAWGMLVWGFGPYRTMLWLSAKEDVTVGRQLLEQFPERGTYYVPSFSQEPEETEALFSSGPVAFVHMLSPQGRPMHDSSIMIKGFVLNACVVLLIALLLQRTSKALPRYVDRVKVAALVGVTAAVLIDCGDAVWWQISWSWKLYQAAYNASAPLVVGLVLAAFMRGETPDASRPAQTEG